MAALLSALSVTIASLNVRLATRKDIVPLANLVDRSFAAAGRTDCLADGETTFASSQRRGWPEQQVTLFRLGLDIERRNTPWDWCRHAQVVAETTPGGDIIGFCEVWGEDKASLRNESAVTPQPAIFNLCVASEARRRGVAQALLEHCEELSTGWGDSSIYLKVRSDNAAAIKLYDEAGWQTVETRARSELPAWQERWKGGGVPLVLMRKPLPIAPLPEEAAASPLAELGSRSSQAARPNFDEFEVTLWRVLQYENRDALVWFALLFLRNLEFLTPTYKLLPGLAAIVVWASYYAVIRVLSFPEEFPMLTGAGVSVASAGP